MSNLMLTFLKISFRMKIDKKVIEPLPIFFFIGNRRKEERAERKNSDTLIFLP